MLLFMLLSSTVPLKSPLMDYIDYLEVRGLLDIKVIKPYELSDVLRELDSLFLIEDNLNSIDKKFISSFEPLVSKSREFYCNYLIDGGMSEFKSYQANIDFRMTGQVVNNTFFDQGIRFRFGSEIDSAGPRPWKDFAQAYLNEGLLRVNKEKLSLSFGRRNLFLGFGDEHSLLLSSTNEGYDGYLLLISGKYYEFNSTFSVIDIEEMRFLSTHRLGLNLKNFKFGFSEAILWARDFEPLYLNFLLPYYLSQWGIDRNDNIMWCFDGMFRVLSNTLLYGEFLIDDYQYSEPPPGYEEYPHKLAYQFGFKTIPWGRFYLKLNYTFVDKWVYTHPISVNVYEKDSLSLGFPQGNDVDRVAFSIKYLNASGVIPGLAIEYVRKGAGDIFLPYEEERGSANPPFPSDTVETKLKITFGIDVQFARNFYLKTSFGLQYYNNYKHIWAHKKTENLFLINLTAIF